MRISDWSSDVCSSDLLEARYGFNRVTPRLFILDALKTLAITLVLGTPLAAGVLWVMANAGTNWVWWAWGIWVGFNFLILWLFPTVIAPIFNKFTPLDNPEMAERIHDIGSTSCRERVCKYM